jgi:hypothetical protein
VDAQCSGWGRNAGQTLPPLQRSLVLSKMSMKDKLLLKAIMGGKLNFIERILLKITTGWKVK